MNSFENGEMTPMAYSYLMNLTYQWWLTDNKEEKDIYEQIADEFRETNYMTTGNKNIDDNIKEMSSIPIESITQEEHYFRNELNIQFTWEQFEKLQKRLPDNLKWQELSIYASAFHQNTALNGDNKKYVSSDGHFELVYTSNGVLLTQNNCPEDMGTYNYYGPDKAKMHSKFDVTPYSKYKNVKNSGENIVKSYKNASKTYIKNALKDSISH